VVSDFDLSELVDLTEDIHRAVEKAPQSVRPPIQDGAKQIKADAQALVPRRTGQLAKSITYDTRNTPDGAVAEIGPDRAKGGWYGHFVERGTSKMGPEPYMLPAADAHMAAIERDIADAAEKLL